MHIIPPPAPRFLLVRASLRLGVFSSREAVGQHLGMATLRELYYEEQCAEPAAPWYAVNGAAAPPLALVDDAGDSISWKQVYFACRAQARLNARDRFHAWNGEGPVPGTGRGRCYHRKRLPRTTQELRLIAGVVAEDGEPEWRMRRRHVPTAWDDLFPTRERSWKHHRRTRWK